MDKFHKCFKQQCIYLGIKIFTNNVVDYDFTICFSCGGMDRPPTNTHLISQSKIKYISLGTTSIMMYIEIH